ncbi:hypothetical protein [Halegenticoccus soli]|nr:hypothetical protein [Halegenticoccus soli]
MTERPFAGGARRSAGGRRASERVREVRQHVSADAAPELFDGGAPDGP